MLSLYRPGARVRALTRRITRLPFVTVIDTRTVRRRTKYAFRLRWFDPPKTGLLSPKTASAAHDRLRTQAGRRWKRPWLRTSAIWRRSVDLPTPVRNAAP